jgi:serine/threonine-protein kinase ATR
VTIILKKIIFIFQYHKQTHQIEPLLNANKISWDTALRQSCFVLYERMYVQNPIEKRQLQTFLDNNMNVSVKEMFQFDRFIILGLACARYERVPNFSIDVIKEFGDENNNLSDLDKCADYVASMFLAVLNFFENELKSKTAEKELKQMIVESIGELIRFLGQRISSLYFKIMCILKEIADLKDINAKKACLELWYILASHCNSAQIGPFLGVIIVSLEDFVEEYPDRVEDICTLFIANNSSLLSSFFKNLFFINVTKHSDEVKAMVMYQIDGQNLSDGFIFDLGLENLVKQLRNDHADSVVKYYCLVYLEDLVRHERKRFDALITASNEVHPKIEQLVFLLTNSSKNTCNKRLKLQLAKCFGELGAIKPIQKMENKNINSFVSTVHSNAFAKEMLAIICKYYKDVNDMSKVQNLSLAVQGIFKDRKVTKTHKIWQYLSKETRVLFEPLITSRYKTKEHSAGPMKDESIFWNRAQSDTSWAYMMTESIAQEIDNADTRSLLKDLILSMRDNQEISLYLFPKIVLEYFKSSSSKEYEDLLLQEINTVFQLILNNKKWREWCTEELKYVYIPDFDFEPIKTPKENSWNQIQSKSVKTAKMIFEVMDVLSKYAQNHSNDKNSTKTAVDRINHLLDQFSPLQMAQVTFKCGEYERALVFWERHILKNMEKDNRDAALAFLIKIYAKLREPDLVDGVKWLRKSNWPLRDQIFICDVTGNLENCDSLIEMRMREPSLMQEEIENILSCFIQANQHEEALLHCKGHLEKMYAANSEQPFCDEIMIEPLWRLAKWDDLDKLLGSQRLALNDNAYWSVSCGKLILKFRNIDREGFWEELDRVRLSVMDNFNILCDADHSMYNGNYENIVRLHMLTEFGMIFKVLTTLLEKKNSTEQIETIKRLIEDLDYRRKLLQPSLNVIESTLAVRRTLLTIMKERLQLSYSPSGIQDIRNEIDTEISKTWTDCASIALKQNLFIQAKAYLLEASKYKSHNAVIEQQKYLFKIGDHIGAQKCLQSGLENFMNMQESLSAFISAGDLSNENTLIEELEVVNKMTARIQLKIAKNYAKLRYMDFDTNKELFEKAITVGGVKNCTKALLQLGDYIDRYYFEMNEQPSLKQLFEIMKAYGSCCMRNDSEYILQPMSRFLQIWFDATALYEQNAKMKTRENMTIIKEMNNYVIDKATSISVAFFYMAFSQLVSRLCHPSAEVFKIIKDIIVSLHSKFPEQSMWFVVTGMKSKSDLRQERTKEIFKKMTNDQDFLSVIDFIMTFSQTKSPQDKPYMIKINPQINKIFQRCQILMPLQQNLQITPECDEKKQLAQECLEKDEENDFSTGVFIQKLELEFEVMKSMQRPKKITLLGNDGKKYPMLLKFKDDLRIDFRFLEFVNVVNDFYRKDSSASRRRLVARTYSVIPLNEEIGIIGKSQVF